MEGLYIPFTPALALVEEERRGRSWAGSPSSHFSPSSQPDSPSQKGQRPRGRFAGRPACYKLPTSFRARVSTHWRVKGTGLFRSLTQRSSKAKSTKTLKQIENQWYPITRKPPAQTVVLAKLIKTTFSFFHVSSSSGFQGGKQECPQSTAWSLPLRSEVASNKQECSGLIQPHGEEEEIPLPDLPPASPQSRWAWQGTLRMVTRASGTLTCPELSGTICGNGWSPSWLQGSCLFLNDSAWTLFACISDD